MIESLIEKIHENLARVAEPIDDIQKWDQLLQAKFSGYPVYNWTDGFNYSKCHTYEILLHKYIFSSSESLIDEQTLIRKLGGNKHSILIKLSIILPYYLTTVLQRQLDAKGEIIERSIIPETNFHLQMLEKANQFAERHGFQELPRDYLSYIIPDIKLELASPGTVTVYNCLFEDQDNVMNPIIF
jgi:hypothetical protein